MAGFDFSGALRAGSSLGDAWQSGVEERQAQEDRQRAIAAAEVKMRQDAQDRARAEQTRSAIGEALRTGDYRSALAAAYTGGLDKVGDGLRNVYEKDREWSEKGSTAFAHAALEHLKQPLEARGASILANKAYYVSMGADPAVIDQIAANPTNEVLAPIAGIDYSQEKRVEHANTAYANQTDRIEAENPVVVNGSLVTRGGEELFRAPQYITAGTDSNVLEVGGQESSGYTGTSTLNADQTFDRMIGAESAGQQFGRDGKPLTSSAGAIGIAQVMPGTAPEAARLAGLAFDENRYRTDPVYNRALGKAYFQEQVRRYGGDLLKATAAYNAGPGNVDRAVARAGRRGGDWQQYLPAETRSYVTKVHGRHGTTRTTRVIQQGVPKPSGGANGSGNGKGNNSTTARQALAQLANVEKLTGEVEKDGWTGYVFGRVPGGLDAESDKFDTAVAQLFTTIRKLTKTVGEGAISDYETRLQQMTVPKRTQTPEGRREAIRGLRELVTEILNDPATQRASATAGADGVVTVTSKAEAMQLPAGTRFRAPNGKVYVR